MIEITKKMKEKPSFNFYCVKCNLFFKVEEGINLDDIKCPECETYEIFIELDFDPKKSPSYIT